MENDDIAGDLENSAPGIDTQAPGEDKGSPGSAENADPAQAPKGSAPNAYMETIKGLNETVSLLIDQNKSLQSQIASLVKNGTTTAAPDMPGSADAGTTAVNDDYTPLRDLDFMPEGFRK